MGGNASRIRPFNVQSGSGWPGCQVLAFLERCKAACAQAHDLMSKAYSFTWIAATWVRVFGSISTMAQIREGSTFQ
jgi:hypothetical protein